MKARRYAHIYAHQGKHVLTVVDGRDVVAEYNELSATRNDRLDESERDATLGDVIDWLERTVDDGALRRYVPIETALLDGIRATGYGRTVRYSAADVRDASE